MTDPETTQDPRMTRLLASELARVPGLRERHSAVVRNTAKPPSGSQAEQDQQHVLGRFVWELASQSLGVAGDHLEAWRRLIERAHVQPAWAHVTLLRAAIEASSYSRWLLDPAATPAQRVQRGVAAQLADWDERRKFEEASGIDKMPLVGAARTGRQRVDELITLRAANGVTEVHVKPYVELCAAYAVANEFGGNAIYRLASGFAHGKQWTLLLGGASVPEGADPDEPGPRRVEASDLVSVGTTQCAVDTFGAAIADLELYVLSAS